MMNRRDFLRRADAPQFAQADPEWCGSVNALDVARIETAQVVTEA